MDPSKWIQENHFTHPPTPHTTSPVFPHQAERQAYEELREKQLHNERFMTLFYKTLMCIPEMRNVTVRANNQIKTTWYVN